MKFHKKIIPAILILLISSALFTREPAKDETIILPPAYGWIDNGEINIYLHAWTFEMEENSVLRNSIIKILGKSFDVDNVENKKLFEDRLRYFLVDNKRRKNIAVDILGERYALPQTASNGHSDAIIKIKNNSKSDLINKRINFSTVSSQKDNPVFSGSFQIIGAKGYSIISDIDDTIKISNVLNRDELVENTFTKKFKPVNGMSKFYKIFEKKGCAFHYVSGSPWQLYPSISDFIIAEQFPAGSVNLKYFRVKDRSLFEFISADQLAYKLGVIKTIMDRFPQRQFILIGDSGEKDPEVYSELANQYNGRIKYIFIRDVGLIDEGSQRRRDVAAKSGSVKMIIFKEAKELESYAENLK
jgi:phosphatidate phosphatase APP1